MTFDIPQNLTVEKIGTKTIAIKTTGHEKSPMTVMLGCQSDGSKLPPMVIFKRKTLPREKIPAGIIVKANQKGYVNKEMTGSFTQILVYWYVIQCVPTLMKK